MRSYAKEITQEIEQKIHILHDSELNICFEDLHTNLFPHFKQLRETLKTNAKIDTLEEVTYEFC